MMNSRPPILWARQHTKSEKAAGDQRAKVLIKLSKSKMKAAYALKANQYLPLGNQKHICIAATGRGYIGNKLNSGKDYANFAPENALVTKAGTFPPSLCCFFFFTTNE